VSNKKPTTVYQPWVFVEIALLLQPRQAPTASPLTTTTNSSTCSAIFNIGGQSSRRPVPGQASIDGIFDEMQPISNKIEGPFAPLC